MTEEVLRARGATTFIDLTDMTFGRLHVESLCAGPNSRGKLIWNVVCECGTRKAVMGDSLRRGTTISCGCFRRTRGNPTHGHTRETEYYIWKGLIRRCHESSNKAFDRYGGRGIVVCERWRDSYELFVADMGRRPSKEHSIDRIDGNGHYEPTNCRWATWKEQARNSRNYTGAGTHLRKDELRAARLRLRDLLRQALAYVPSNDLRSAITLELDNE